MTPRSTVLATVANRKAQAELSRIQWRARLMGLPGGVSLLLALCRRMKFKEQACSESAMEVGHER